MSEELLEKCMHGKTQNANEALNSIIWSRVPKATFVGRETFEMGVHSAVIHYNDGKKGLLQVLSHFGLKGAISQIMAEKIDDSRIARMNRRSTDQDKKQRKRLIARKKGYTDDTKEKSL